LCCRLAPFLWIPHDRAMIRSSYLYVSMGWLCLVILPHSIAADRITGKAFATRSEVIAEHGAAATSHPLATQIALDILKQGGNAVDAAIGANAALALMEPVSCGLGGDLFVMLWDSESHQLHGLNGSG